MPAFRQYILLKTLIRSAAGSEKKAKKPVSVEQGRVSERSDSCAQPSLCMSEKTLKKVCDENSGERFLVMTSAGHS